MNTTKQPRISILEVDTEKMEPVLEDIRNSKSVLTFYMTIKNECKFFHTGLGEIDLATVLILLGRHIALFDFFKLAIINTEKFREGDGMEGFNFTPKVLEYIEWKRNNFNQIRKNDLI